MPNSISATGLTTYTRDELVSIFTTAFENIYGPDIVLTSDSPDGQMMNIFIQAVLDNLDLITQVYNTFDPDTAIGVILDSRVAYNGIQRLAGTATVTNITITTTQALTLPGLDQTTVPAYTVADNAGTQWVLQTTQTPSGAGVYVYSFQAVNPGATLTIPNTITVPVSVVLGVSAINNPTSYTTLGTNEETDAALKIRRQQSVSLGSQGYLSGLTAALKNINGVTSVNVFENDTDAPITFGSDTVPAHSIWVIVSGTASASAIAQAIYTKRNAGCGMYGAQSFLISQVDGSSFAVFWDDVQSENLFIAFYATSLDGVNPPNIALIKSATQGLPVTFAPGANQEVNINTLATRVQNLDPNTLVTFTGSGTPAIGGFATSSGGAYSNTLSPSSKKFQLSVSAANIIVLPMILSPYNPLTAIPIVVTHGHTQQFTGLGGFGTLTYSFITNNSGGSISSSTGLYTAGPTPLVQDTVLVTDGLGNTAQAVVQVT